MLRFTTVDGHSIAIEPRHVVSVEYGVRPRGCKPILPGEQQGEKTATLWMVNGNSFTVPDPDGTVARQIEDYKGASA